MITTFYFILIRNLFSPIFWLTLLTIFKEFSLKILKRRNKFFSWNNCTHFCCTVFFQHMLRWWYIFMLHATAILSKSIIYPQGSYFNKNLNKNVLLYFISFFFLSLQKHFNVGHFTDDLDKLLQMQLQQTIIIICGKNCGFSKKKPATA